MVLRILDIHMQKNLSGQLSYTTQKKINSKWIKDLNVRPKPITLLDENIRGKKSPWKHFLYIIHQTHRQLKQKSTCGTMSKLKSFCIAKETTNWTKSQPTKHISDKEIICLNNSNNNSNLKISRGLQLTFIQRKYTNGQQIHEDVLYH